MFSKIFPCPTAVSPVPISVIYDLLIYKTDLADKFSFYRKEKLILRVRELATKTYKILCVFPFFGLNFHIPCVFPDREFSLFPCQCPKLRVHPAPGVHISTAGCTILGGVHPMCARFLSHLLLLYIGRVHGGISGCSFMGSKPCECTKYKLNFGHCLCSRDPELKVLYKKKKKNKKVLSVTVYLQLLSREQSGTRSLRWPT